MVKQKAEKNELPKSSNSKIYPTWVKFIQSHWIDRKKNNNKSSKSKKAGIMQPKLTRDGTQRLNYCFNFFFGEHFSLFGLSCVTHG